MTSFNRMRWSMKLAPISNNAWAWLTAKVIEMQKQSSR